jgi:hypothetical protein
MGDFPVPPTLKFPTQMMGRLMDVDGRTFLSYNLFRSHIAAPYSKANGNNKKRMD